MSSPRRLRDVLLVLLAVTAGAIDATAFERLGHVFASVITGNLVLVGVGAVRADGTLGLFAGGALGAYAVGVFVAAPRSPDSTAREMLWPRAASLALLAETLLVGAFAVGWELAGTRSTETTQAVLLAAAAAAMGIQSTAVRRLGQMSTTYLTSTTIALVEALAARRWPAGQSRGVGIIGAAVAGAAAATALGDQARAWLPALPLLPLVVVLLASRRLAGAPAAEDPQQSIDLSKERA